MANTSAAGEAVATAYDGIVGVGADKEARKQSQIYHFRNLQNWIKSSLIQEYARAPCTHVMEIACGKFGDLYKWQRVGVTHIAAIDISRGQLLEAMSRLGQCNARDGRQIAAKFVWADVGHVNLYDFPVLSPSETFTAVSCQFALHYMFETEATALTLFRNIAGRLRPGGVFLATVPDAHALIRRLRDLPEEGLEFGNSLFTVKFAAEAKRRQWCMGDNPFGIRYSFFLKVTGGHAHMY